jgi:hypothetical protein
MFEPRNVRSPVRGVQWVHARAEILRRAVLRQRVRRNEQDLSSLSGQSFLQSHIFQGLDLTDRSDAAHDLRAGSANLAAVTPGLGFPCLIGLLFEAAKCVHRSCGSAIDNERACGSAGSTDQGRRAAAEPKVGSVTRALPRHDPLHQTTAGCRATPCGPTANGLATAMSELWKPWASTRLSGATRLEDNNQAGLAARGHGRGAVRLSQGSRL